MQSSVVCNTADLPQSSGEAERFDPDRLQEHGQQLLHFLRQRCRREGGTYWLFREQNSSRAELFDISNSAEQEDEDGNWETSAAFRTSPSLATPIASLCFHLSKSMSQDSDQRQLLQKATQLLEPLQEEQYGLYATAALQLACSYMRTPVAAISDKGSSVAAPPGKAPAAARLSVAMRYLEKVLRLLSSLSDDASTLRAGLLLQGQVAYAECILKLVKEACIPTYSAWLAQVQRSSQEIIQKHGASSAAAQKQLSQMKQLSAAFLLWRLFWLCRAHRALSFLAAEKREVECWTLDRDLMEVMGDTLYGLSRYPAEDVKSLLGGHMSSAEGICSSVAAGLRSWALSGGKVVVDAQSSEGRRSKRRLPSPAASSGDEEAKEPYDVGAMFLSKLNPLHRALGDRALAEDSLVRDDLRPKMWTEGLALQRCMACPCSGNPVHPCSIDAEYAQQPFELLNEACEASCLSGLEGVAYWAYLTCDEYVVLLWIREAIGQNLLDSIPRPRGRRILYMLTLEEFLGEPRQTSPMQTLEEFLESPLCPGPCGPEAEASSLPATPVTSEEDSEQTQSPAEDSSVVRQLLDAMEAKHKEQGRKIGIMLQTLTARLISLDARISDVVQEQDHRASCRA
eukprot:s755_g32.t1